MANAPATSRLQPFSIEQLVRSAESGKLRVPEFQRSFRWTSSDVVELLDSIRRGYPIGNALLWKREAAAARVQLGELTIDAPDCVDALWVVDGQQRITSLINAVNPAVDPASVFAVVYVPEHNVFRRPKDVHGQIAIPVPDLFSIPRLFAWLQANPDAVDHATGLQEVTTILRDFVLPTSIIEGADEDELRRIFDRINNAGKKLTAAEVFDAINRTSATDGSPHSVRAISDGLAASTTFGTLPSPLVYQAVLVRRHPDLSRSPQSEFDADRRALSDFPGEDQSESFAATEAALRATVHFLQRSVGVPHVAFLPQQFLLLTVTRFLSLFPNPSPRTKTLLSRWFWRAAARAPRLGISGASNTVRGIAGLIRADDEQGSIQRLLDAVALDDESVGIDFTSFRTNQAASKIMLCAMWAHHPRSLTSGEVITESALDAALGDTDTPADMVAELFRRRDLTAELRGSVGNRMIIGPDDVRFAEWLTTTGGPDAAERDAVLASHFLTAAEITQSPIDVNRIVGERASRIAAAVEHFIAVRGGRGLDDTPSLASLDLDDEFGADREFDTEGVQP